MIKKLTDLPKALLGTEVVYRKETRPSVLEHPHELTDSGRVASVVSGIDGVHERSLQCVQSNVCHDVVFVCDLHVLWCGTPFLFCKMQMSNVTIELTGTLNVDLLFN